MKDKLIIYNREGTTTEVEPIKAWQPDEHYAMEQAVESDLARQLNKIIIEDINRQIVEGEPKPTEATQPEPPLYYKPNRHDRRAAAARARKERKEKARGK